MSLLGLLFDVLGPVVAIATVGAVAGPRLKLDIGTLSRLAYWVLGPAFVFDLFVTTEVAASTALRLAGAGWVGMAAAAIAVVVLGYPVGLAGRPRRAAVMTGAYGNVGNAGLAISAFALGEEALAASGVLMLALNLTGIMTGVALSSGEDQSPLRAVTRAILSPMPIAGALALVVNLIDLEPPLIALRSTGLLADAMIPVMLFTLGLQLVGSGRPRPSAPLLVSSAAKLIVAPVAAALAAAAFGLTGDDFAVVVVQSAMPPAVFCVLVALEYELEPAQVTDSVVITTLLSLLTVPIVLSLVT